MKINRKFNIALILVIMLVLLSTTTYAKPFTDAFTGGLTEINNFFANEQYKPYAKTIDFFFFALLFIAIYMMGVRYAFKEVKRPEQVIAILLGLMTAFLLVLGGFSATILLPYLHWLLYTLLFILYWWLLKGIKNKFWRFVLALLLTLLTIALIQGLFGALTAPEIGAPDTTGIGGTGIGGFFKSFGDSFKGIDFGGIGTPGIPSWLSDLYGAPGAAAPTGPSTLPSTTTPGVTTTPTTPETGFFGRNWWWLLLLLLLLALAVWQRDKIKDWLKTRRSGQSGEGTTPTTQEELTIQKIIEEISKYIKKKLEILNKINEIVARKKALNKLQRDLYYKAIEFDQAYWIDPDSEANKLFEKHGETLGALLKLELELEKELKGLMDIEKELVGVVGERFGKLVISPYKRGKAGRWIILLEGPFDEKRSKEIADEIDKIEKLTPLLWREKFLDLVYRLLNVKEVPEWYKTRFKQITNLIDELIMTYQWDPQTMRFIIREPQLIQKPDGTNEIARDDKGRIIWTYPSNVPGQPGTITPGGRYARWIINPDDMKILQAGWFSDSPSICEVVMRYISYYLLLATEQGYKQKAWRKLVHPKQLEKVVKNKDRWKAIKKLWKGKPQEEIPDILMNHFKEEDEFFNTQFKPAVYKELQHMYKIIRHLKYLTSEREETTMQELRVEYIDAAGEKKEYSEGQLNTQRHPNFVLPTIPRDKFIRVYTLLATGKGPKFKLACSVRTPPDNPQGGQFIRSNDLVRGATNRYLPKTKPYEKTEAHPILEWKSEEFTDRFGDKLTDGEHEVYLYLVGPKPAETPQTPIAQSYRDLRGIKVRIGIMPTPQPTAPVKLLRINRPAPNSEHEIGKYIEDLAAEFVSPKPNLNRQINSGGVAYMHFEWYVVQGTLTFRIHLGRTGPRNFVSTPIPNNFAPGIAQLLVKLYDADAKQYIPGAEADIPIRLIAVTPTYEVYIQNPRDGTFNKGEVIPGLTAVVGDQNGSIVNPTNIGVSLRWFIVQRGKSPQTIMDSSGAYPIADYFDETAAQLFVALVDGKGNTIATSLPVNITIGHAPEEEEEEPPPTPQNRDLKLIEIDKYLKLWRVIGHSVHGMSHIRRGHPNQDYISALAGKDGYGPPIILAVADGVSSEARSELGAQFATESAIEEIKELLSLKGSPKEIEEIIIKYGPKNIVSRWHTKVHEHYTKNPFDDKNLYEYYKKIQDLDSYIKRKTEQNKKYPASAYHSTLLCVVVTEHFIVCLQIGDGDICIIKKDGSLEKPLKDDTDTLGTETHSIGEKDAWDEFRAKSLEMEYIDYITVSTDGLSTSYKEPEKFLIEVGKWITEVGIDKANEELEELLKTAAEKGGDDTTLGIICRLKELIKPRTAESQTAGFLTPINSMPSKPIAIYGIYHASGEAVLKIGKKEDDNIIIKDSDVDILSTQFVIMFVPERNRFIIQKHPEANIIINDKTGDLIEWLDEKKMTTWLDKNATLQLNNYLFKFNLWPVPTSELIGEDEYKKQFDPPIILRLIQPLPLPIHPQSPEKTIVKRGKKQFDKNIFNEVKKRQFGNIRITTSGGRVSRTTISPDLQRKKMKGGPGRQRGWTGKNFDKRGK